jgi:hypothetical protein
MAPIIFLKNNYIRYIYCRSDFNPPKLPIKDQKLDKNISYKYHQNTTLC